ncbi:MAG TPA: response regulator transcription factor [Solirubrobacteraceae bacterium]|nr:response regulator transcription factor [Solirubrobacteraceae bacterium]
MYREGISRLIATADSLELAGAAGTGESLARLRQGARPDVVLVDAIERVELVLALQIPSAAGDAHVVALVAPERVEDLLAWVGAGVSGFLSWQASPEQLVESLKRAARGESPCPEDVADALLRGVRQNPGGSFASRGSLTEREAQIAELVADGMSNKAIASRLSIELATVKNHVHSILEKLRVHSRGEAAAKLRSTGVGRRG